MVRQYQVVLDPDAELAGIAAVALGFGHVHGMTLGFGSTLLGEAVDYAIYYLIQARAGGAALWLRVARATLSGRRANADTWITATGSAA